VNLSIRPTALVRIPHAGDEQELWITDYATALPGPSLSDCSGPESECKETTH
jgi:hypothetical protein